MLQMATEQGEFSSESPGSCPGQYRAEVPLVVRPCNESVPGRGFTRAHRRSEDEGLEACPLCDEVMSP